MNWIKLGVSASALALLAVCLVGCETLAYYGQAIGGQWQLLASREPIPALLQQSGLEPSLKQKLSRVMAMRQFAEQQLLLPVGHSYESYVDLNRPYVVWNVYAAPEFSLTPKTWCFPIAGCVSYRGYFSQPRAQWKAAELQREGYDVYVGGVAAYSSLGWFSDPVLNTFVRRDEAGLAALLFHELAHKQLYVPGDSTFNESFARAVELEGVKRWLQQQQKQPLFDAYLEDQQRFQQLLALLLTKREQLEMLYASSIAPAPKRQQKQQILQSIRDDFAAMNGRGEYQRYAGWMSRPFNNARLSNVATYHRWVPAFQQLLVEQDGDWQRFYRACEQLAQLSLAQRQTALAQLAQKRADRLPKQQKN